MPKIFSCRLRAGLLGARVIAGLSALAAIVPVSYAIGPTGPIGPSGPVGSDRGAQQRAGAAASSATEPSAARHAPGTRSAGNRIEVTGNTASNVRCTNGGAASVNSVDVQGARLEGQTFIVQGRNVQDVDCPPAKEDGSNTGGRAQPSSQINSIIR